MFAYLMTVLVLDHDGGDSPQIGNVKRELRNAIENARYPNHWPEPSVLEIQHADIGEWDDGNPLNFSATQAAEVARLFPPDPDTVDREAYDDAVTRLNRAEALLQRTRDQLHALDPLISDAQQRVAPADLLARITDGIDEIEAELKEALGDDVGGGDTEGVTTTGSAVNPLQQRKSAALYYNDGEDGFSAAPKGEIRAEDIPKNPSPFDPRPGALDMSIQFTYSKPDAPDPDRRHTALFTCRGKDHDLDAVQWRRVAEAAGRIAERLEADDRRGQR